MRALGGEHVGDERRRGPGSVSNDVVLVVLIVGVFERDARATVAFHDARSASRIEEGTKSARRRDVGIQTRERERRYFHVMRALKNSS